MILQRLVVGPLSSNCYLVGCDETREAMIIDPGGDAEEILAAVEKHKLHVTLVVLTHFHFDHALAAKPVCQATGARLAIHYLEVGYLREPPVLFRLFSPEVPRGLEADLLLHDGDVLQIGTLQARVLHTPGHSPGSISLWLEQEGVLFSGDLLFQDGVGRTDFPGSSAWELMRSIQERIFTLPEETVVYPGHGPETTVGTEKRYNPWVGAGRG
ncbi:MAG: MBL fold metallo-hydrolase [Chloroflexi bacterium]|nr:MBL fold metallo-hydrolase [Chloroflexota bacterium]